MRKNPMTTKAPAEQVLKDIRRATRKLHLACPLKVVLSEVWLTSHVEYEGMPQKKHKPEEIVAKLRWPAPIGWSGFNLSA